MTELSEHQFEILPSAEAQDGFVFGIGAEVSIDAEGFDPGEVSWTTQDSANTRRSVLGFGRDSRDSRTWLWSSHVDRTSIAEAVDTLERFSTAWAPQDVVESPGEHVAIRYRLAGRTRRIFGRPRRFAAPPSNLITSGYVPVTHDFSLIDAHTYDDAESNVSIPYISAASGGGFVLPATMPITSTPTDGVGGDQLAVGGTARAYPVVRFYGPWWSPKLITDHWTLAWNGNIPANGYVEVDCRPWALTVLNQSGGSAVEHLDRRTVLEDCYFAAGSRPQVTLSGAAASGEARAEIRWRNTFNSI